MVSFVLVANHMHMPPSTFSNVLEARVGNDVESSRGDDAVTMKDDSSSSDSGYASRKSSHRRSPRNDSDLYMCGLSTEPPEMRHHADARHTQVALLPYMFSYIFLRWDRLLPASTAHDMK